MKIRIAVAAFALLAACQGREEPANEAAAEDLEPPTDTPTVSLPAQAPPPPDGFGWTGRFAATPELCSGGVWDIDESRIVTDGETSCQVRRVGRAPGQVTLSLACTAEGRESDESWTLSPRSVDGLRVERRSGAGPSAVDLVRCPV